MGVFAGIIGALGLMFILWGVHLALCLVMSPPLSAICVGVGAVLIAAVSGPIATTASLP